MILDIAIIIFCIMELGNVLILYFKPDSKFGNGVAVFDAWRDVKEDKNLDLFAHYMAYWVAGIKLIFILLTGNETTKIWSVVAMIISIATYF